MFLINEYNSIMHDKKFLDLVPNVINCGFFAVSMSEIKNELTEIIDELLSNLKNAFVSKAAQIIIKNENVFSEFINSMEQEPKTIEDYVNSKKFLESDEFAKKLVYKQKILPNTLKYQHNINNYHSFDIIQLLSKFKLCFFTI